MATYVYECTECEHQLETVQSMSDKPLVRCPECNKHKLKRLLFPPILAVVSEPRTVGMLADKNAEKKTFPSKPQPGLNKSDREVMAMTPDRAQEYVEKGK